MNEKTEQNNEIIQDDPIAENTVEEKEPEEKTSFVKELLSFFKELVICCAVVMVLCNFVVRPIRVSGDSMYPTLQNNNIGFANILGYKTSGVERFDIVIVYLAERDEYLVKRVIALPGETMSYTDGRLCINGEAIEEDFLNTEYAEGYGNYFMEDIPEITMGNDDYYCLGDNRPHSSDSRVYGAFSSEDIIAKGAFIIFPFSNFGVKTW